MLNKIKSKIKESSISKTLKDEEKKHKLVKKAACIGFGTLVGITTYSKNGMLHDEASGIVIGTNSKKTSYANS